MIKGTIKFFNKAKGFGFITPDDGSRDVFLPPTTVTATGAARLKTGQRVTFEAEPDVKGPKAVKLQLLDEPPKEVAPPAPKAGVTLYYDGGAEEAEDLLDALKAAGQQPRLIDYSAVPLTHDQLKRLAMMLREVDQSLVRRYDHLFLELQLDDRFISENDFWTAIVEHPGLINGPVAVVGNRARICKSVADLRAFLGMEGEGHERKPKSISPRMMAMMTGQPVPARAEPEQPRKSEVPVKPAPVRSEAVAARPEPKPESKPVAVKAEPKPAKAKKAVAKKTDAPAKAKKKAPAAKASAKAPPKAKPAAKKGRK